MPTQPQGEILNSWSGVTSSYVTRNDKSRRIVFRVWRKLRLSGIRLFSPVLPQRLYMRWLTKTLRDYGMRIEGEPIYISAHAWFDGTDYSLISIGNKVVISSHVSILTHDFSLARARDAIENRTIWPEVAVVRSVSIGDNCFVGRGSILMPGTKIGANAIIGAGAVVRGTVPEGTIAVGNPAVIVGNSLEWGRKKLAEFGIEAPS